MNYKYFLKNVFLLSKYPSSIWKSILSQLFISIFFVSMLFFLQNYFYYSVEDNFKYLSKNIISDPIDEYISASDIDEYVDNLKYDELSQALSNNIIKYDYALGTSVYIKTDSTNPNLTMLQYCDEIDYFSQVIKETRIQLIYEKDFDGIYINKYLFSEYFGEINSTLEYELEIQVGDLHMTDFSKKVKIKGIYDFIDYNVPSIDSNSSVAMVQQIFMSHSCYQEFKEFYIENNYSFSLTNLYITDKNLSLDDISILKMYLENPNANIIMQNRYFEMYDEVINLIDIYILMFIFTMFFSIFYVIIEKTKQIKYIIDIQSIFNMKKKDLYFIILGSNLFVFLIALLGSVLLTLIVSFIAYFDLHSFIFLNLNFLYSMLIFIFGIVAASSISFIFVYKNKLFR